MAMKNISMKLTTISTLSHGYYQLQSIAETLAQFRVQDSFHSASQQLSWKLHKLLLEKKLWLCLLLGQSLSAFWKLLIVNDDVRYLQQFVNTVLNFRVAENTDGRAVPELFENLAW